MLGDRKQRGDERWWPWRWWQPGEGTVRSRCPTCPYPPSLSWVLEWGWPVFPTLPCVLTGIPCNLCEGLTHVSDPGSQKNQRNASHDSRILLTTSAHQVHWLLLPAQLLPVPSRQSIVRGDLMRLILIPSPTACPFLLSSPSSVCLSVLVFHSCETSELVRAETKQQYF